MIKNKIKNDTGPEKRKREIPNSLIISFTSVLLAFGLDFGFSKIFNKNVKYFANCFCCFSPIFFITTIIIQIVDKIENARLTASSWIIYGFIQYSFHVIFLRFSNYNLYNFIVDMYLVEANTKGNKNKENLIVNLVIIFFWIHYALMGVFCYFYCTSETDECKTLFVPGYLYCILYMGMNVITVVQILIYYYIYKTVKFLNVSLEVRNKDIKCVRNHYTAVADICDKITPTYGRLVSTYFVFNHRLLDRLGCVVVPPSSMQSTWAICSNTLAQNVQGRSWYTLGRTLMTFSFSLGLVSVGVV